MSIAWGSTMNEVSHHVSPKRTHTAQIVQLNGAGNTRSTGVGYANEIVQRCSPSPGARREQFPVPIFFDDPATRMASWRDRGLRRLLEMQGNMNIALFSIGSPFSKVPSHVYVGGYLDDDEIETLSDAGVVGDVATLFYRTDVSTDNMPPDDRGIGLEMSVLRRTPGASASSRAGPSRTASAGR